MPKKKPLHHFSLFCSICKEHVEVHAEDKKQAQGKFDALGHQTIRVVQLRRGVPGVLTQGDGEHIIPYFTRKQQRDMVTQEKKAKRKKRGSKVVTMQEERLVEEAHGA